MADLDETIPKVVGKLKMLLVMISVGQEPNNEKNQKEKSRLYSLILQNESTIRQALVCIKNIQDEIDRDVSWAKPDPYDLSERLDLGFDYRDERGALFAMAEQINLRMGLASISNTTLAQFPRDEVGLAVTEFIREPKNIPKHRS